MKEILIKKGSTLLLRAVIIILALVTLAICIFALPSISRGIVAEFPNIMYPPWLIWVGMWSTAIPFFFALYQAFTLLNYVDHNKAFSDLSLKALRNIKYATIFLTLLYLAGMPVVFGAADADDAPGLVIIGLVFACSPVIVALFATVLGKLIKSAMEMKSENDLTV